MSSGKMVMKVWYCLMELGCGSFLQLLHGTLECCLTWLIKWILGRLYSFLSFSETYEGGCSAI